MTGSGQGETPLAWLVVARREFLERVRTAWFLIATLLGPIGISAVILLPAWLGEAQETAEIRVVDRTGLALGSGVVWAVGLVNADVRPELAPPDTPDDELIAKVRDGEIAGYLIVPEDALGGGTVVYSGRNAADMRFVFTIREVVNMAIRSARAQEVGLSRAEVAELFAPAAFDARHTTGKREATSGTGSFVIGYAVMFILYMAILLYAVNVLRSVVQEKTSRAVEMIVSAARPRSLMLGKVMGVGAVGLFQLGIWGVLGFVLLQYREGLLALVGISGGGFEIPVIPPAAVALILAYFLLGYFFYASLYAAIGAMVSSDQEAQQAQTPLVILLVIPVVLVNLVTSDPSGAVAQVLTLIPFSSPVLMPMRYLLGGASPADLIASIAILLFAIAAAVWIAARIYRVGILSHGKRPSMRELIRWIRD
jgi:ABC-2 type transport system permease protein